MSKVVKFPASHYDYTKSKYYRLGVLFKLASDSETRRLGDLLIEGTTPLNEIMNLAEKTGNADLLS